MPQKKAKEKVSMGISWLSLSVLGVLILLLSLEFTIAQFTVPRLLILALALLQAGIILWEYMHIKRVFSGGSSAAPKKNGRR